jgi:DNA primase
VVDFKEVKKVASFEEVLRFLGLNLKRNTSHWRGACPACNGDDRSLVVTENRGYFCFSEGRGGDIIALVAHIRGIGMREAAEQLAEHYGMLTIPPKVKAEEKPADRSLTPLQSIAARLDHAAPGGPRYHGPGDGAPVRDRLRRPRLAPQQGGNPNL